MVVVAAVQRSGTAFLRYAGVLAWYPRSKTKTFNDHGG